MGVGHVEANLIFARGKDSGRKQSLEGYALADEKLDLEALEAHSLRSYANTKNCILGATRTVQKRVRHR